MNDDFNELRFLAATMIYANLKNKNKKWVLDVVKNEFNLNDYEMTLIKEIYDILFIWGEEFETGDYLKILNEILLYIV